MKIEAITKDQGLHGGREVWFHVFSHEVLDWPRIEEKLTEAQYALLSSLGARELHYYPHNPLPEEVEEHGFPLEEFWVWRKKATK